MFETSQYKYRVFVTDMSDPIYFVVWFYGQRGGAENLIKEANNDAGLAAHPSGRFDVNGNHFQLAMLAYNLNCWLMLFNREPQADATELRHTTLATARLRFLFVAAKIWRHARPHWGELQRSLRGEGRVRAADGSAAPDRAARAGLCASDAAGPALRQSPRRSLRAPCIEIYARPGKRNEAQSFGAGLGGNRTLGRTMKQRKSN